MELNEISQWMKGTIPGIIVLGALGSTLCISVLKLAVLIFSKWIPKGVHAYNKKRYERGYYFGRMMRFFHDTNHTTGIISIFVYQATGILIGCLTGSTLLILFFIFYLQGENILTISSYLVLVLSIIIFFYSAREYKHLRFIVNLMLTEAEEGVAKEENEESANQTLQRTR
jgi:hypothetical protein